MNFIFFKINIWWKAVLVVGLLACACSVIFKVDFIENKHLFGFGLGMIMVGIAFWIANKTANTIAYGGILSWKITQHNFASITILVIGIVLLLLFLFLIVKGLI